jgi:hypothetical protein
MGVSSHGFDIDFKLRSRVEKLREFLGQATIYRLEAEATTDAEMRAILLRLADAWDQLARNQERLLLRKNAGEQ